MTVQHQGIATAGVHRAPPERRRQGRDSVGKIRVIGEFDLRLRIWLSGRWIVRFPEIVQAENFVINHNLGDVISQSFGATEETFPTVQSLLKIE